MGQGTIPSDWLGEYCRYAVCWPKSDAWLAVLRGVLTLPARGRFWDEHTGSITEAQEVIRQTFDNNLHLEEVIMACNDTGLAQIASALMLLAQNQCCGEGGQGIGSGGAGSTEPALNPTLEGDPLTDEPPEGFETWEEFYHDKCAIAWDILEKLRHDIGEMAIMNIANMSLSGFGAIIAISFATPIPFDDIIAIAALLLAVAWEIVLATTLSILNDNEEELVCELYNGQSSGLCRDATLSKFGSFCDSAGIDPIETFAMKTLMAYMLNPMVTNRLFTKDLTRIWTTKDCSNCVQCEELTFEFEDSSTDGFVTVESLPDCFELTLNGTAILSSLDGVLTVGVASGSPNPNGAFGLTGLSYPVKDNSNIQVTVRVSGAGSAYIDGIVLFEDDTCSWFTFSNNHGASGSFAGISSDLSASDGKTITEVYIFLSSSNDGGDGFTVEFENIQFFCV